MRGSGSSSIGRGVEISGRAGEFSIVIAGLALTTGVEPELASLTGAYVLLLAVAGPVLTRFADHLVRSEV